MFLLCFELPAQGPQVQISCLVNPGIEPVLYMVHVNKNEYTKLNYLFIYMVY